MTVRTKRPHNITIVDVAKAANVSYSTVSRVMNNNPHVKPEKRVRVLEVMDRLGYVVNQSARSLRGGQTQVIGLMVHDLFTEYTGQIVWGVDETLNAAQYDLMIFTTHRRMTRESSSIDTLVQGTSDGVLLLLPLNPGAYLQALRERQFPYVVIDQHGFDTFSPTVTASSYQGAREAIDYLIALGHKRIGFITGTPDVRGAIDRLSAYRDALEAHGIDYDPALVVEGDFQQPGGYRAASILLDCTERPTAIFASNDASAFGAMEAIRSRGLSIPQDISVIGFDDIPQSAHVYPALTTVRQPMAEMGRAATRLLLKYIEDPTLPCEHIVLDTEFIRRESCQPPR